jgi:glyoxylate reductase
MANIYITRNVPSAGIDELRSAGHTVTINPEDRVLSADELLSALTSAQYDAVLCLLTDKISEQVMSAVPSVKIFANYAVGYDNIDMPAARKLGKIISNTPGVLTDAVAEHTVTLALAIMRRIVESDVYLRGGKYTSWAPELLLGSAIRGKTVGIVGLGRIGSRVAEIFRRGFEMNVLYYDVHQNPEFEKSVQASFHTDLATLLPACDLVSVHVPLLPTTKHLFSDAQFQLMKRTAYIVNTSRGPVIDEEALVRALSTGTIRGAALDVFEHEPALTEGLAALANVVITPHTASATEEARSEMSRMAASNILAVLSGRPAPQQVPYPPEA